MPHAGGVAVSWLMELCDRGQILDKNHPDPGIDFDGHIISVNKNYQRLNGKDYIYPPKTEAGYREVASRWCWKAV